MRSWLRLARRIRNIVQPQRLERELDADGRFHDAFLSELRFAVRTLRRTPGFVLAVTLTLALGIGANATMFGLIDRLLLRAPDLVHDPQRVVVPSFYSRDEDGSEWTQRVLSYPMYKDLEQVSAFSGVAAISTVDLALGQGVGAREVRGALVTGRYFDVLGVTPLAGRFFTNEDDALPSGLPVAVVSETFWRSQLAAAPQVLGSRLSVAGRSFTIVGVAPSAFVGHERRPVDLWIPMSAGEGASRADTSWVHSRWSFWLTAVARLRDGVSRNAAVEQATAAWRRGDPERAQRRHTRALLTSVVPTEALAESADARSAKLVAIVSAIVLLIACANVANLQLVRAIRRRREISVRVALGLSRGRLSMQLLLESVLLALLGGVAALVVVFFGGELLRRTLLAGMPLPGAPVSGRVLAFTTALSVGAGVLTGLAPLFEAGRTALTGALKEGTRGAGLRRSRVRSALLVVQAALSVILLVGAGVFVRSLRNVAAIPIGLDASHVLVARVQTTGAAYTDAQRRDMYQRLLDAAQRSPDVESAALGVALPFSTSWGERVRLPGGRVPPTTSEGGPYLNSVTPDFFAVMGTRILRGRGFTASDQAQSERVAVVNQTMARMWWPGEDAIGKCFYVGKDGAPCTTVIGISENARRQAIIEDSVVHYYLPLAQSFQDASVLFVKTRRDPALVRESLRRQLQAAAPDLPYVGMRAMSDALDEQTRSWRLGATMFGAFGALALLLGGIGLFSVLAYDVAQRTHEIGVRVALGARTASVLRMVVGRAMRVVALGAAIGAVLSLAGGRFVAPLLYQTSPRDPMVFALVILVVLGAGVLASLLPARRATRVDPALALRSE